MQKRLERRVVRAAVAALVVAGAGVGVAYATGALSRATSSTITGCAKQSNGDLRIVSNASACAQNENVVEFQAAQAPTVPQAVLVHCSAGQSVNQALVDTAGAPQVQITIRGTCTESVGVNRDNVTLVADASGGGLTSPSAGASVINVNGSRRVFVRGLTLTGGQAALNVSPGSSFSARDLHITGANTAIQINGANGFVQNVVVDSCAGNGVNADSNASLGVSGGSISGCPGSGVSAHGGAHVSLNDGALVSDTNGPGVVASDGGVINLNHATISNSNHFGAFAFGGTVAVRGSQTLITGSAFSGLDASDGGEASLVMGARVSGNNGGVTASNGGSLLIQDGGIVENNDAGGIFLAGGSSLRMRGGAIVRGNAGNGIALTDTSVAQFEPTNQVVDNGGWGLFCAGPPSVALVNGNAGTVTGNGAGQDNCPHA